MGPERPTFWLGPTKTATHLARSRSVRIGVVRFEKSLVDNLSGKRQLSVTKLSAKRIFSLAKRDFLVANGRMAADFEPCSWIRQPRLVWPFKIWLCSSGALPTQCGSHHYCLASALLQTFHVIPWMAITTLAPCSCVHVTFSPSDDTETDNRWTWSSVSWCHTLQYRLHIFQPPTPQASSNPSSEHSVTSLSEVLPGASRDCLERTPQFSADNHISRLLPPCSRGTLAWF